MPQPTVLCDVDGVVADLLSEWLRRYNKQWDDNLTPADIRRWDMTKAVKPECGWRVYDILQEPDLYDSVPQVRGALWGVETLRGAGVRVVFVTSCVVGTTDAKMRWLIEHGFLPFGRYSHLDFVAAHDKALVRGDLLVDDAYHNVVAFPGRAILFNQPYNENAPHPYVARDWYAVVGQVNRLLLGAQQYDFLDHLREGAD